MGEKAHFKATLITNSTTLSDIFVLPLYICVYIAYRIQCNTIVLIAYLARIPLVERHAIENIC